MGFSHPIHASRMVQLCSWNFFFSASSVPTLWESTFGQQDALSQSQAAMDLTGPIRCEFTSLRFAGKKKKKCFFNVVQWVESCNIVQRILLTHIVRVNSSDGLCFFQNPQSPNFVLHTHTHTKAELGVTCGGSKWGRAGLACGMWVHTYHTVYLLTLHIPKSKLFKLNVWH